MMQQSASEKQKDSQHIKKTADNTGKLVDLFSKGLDAGKRALGAVMQ